ncbi:hypothetical protein [Streptomyces chartreusis]
MPRKKKLKAGDDGACPQCRKEVPLVENDRGDLVLRTHHVAAVEQFEHGGSGYGVRECGSSGYPPASPEEVDDTKGDHWQESAPKREGKPTTVVARDIDPPIRVGAPARHLNDSGEPVTLGEAIRRVSGEFERMEQAFNGMGAAASEALTRAATARRDDFALTDDPTTRAQNAATRLQEALEPLLAEYAPQPQTLRLTVALGGSRDVVLSGRAEPSGFEFIVPVSEGALRDPALLDDVIRRTRAETGIRLRERFGSQRTMRMEPTSVEINGVDMTDVITGPIEINYSDVPPAPVTVREAAQKIYNGIDPILTRLIGQAQQININVESHAEELTADSISVRRVPLNTASLTVTASPCGLEATFNVVPSAMTTRTVADIVHSVEDRVRDLVSAPRPWSGDQANLVATVLTHVRQTYIEVTGAPPADAQVSTGGPPDFLMDAPEVLRMRLEPGHVEVRVPIDPFAATQPDFPATAGRQAARIVRRALLDRLPVGTGPQYCNVADDGLPCRCQRDPEHDDRHRCACGHVWGPSPLTEPGEVTCP